MYILFLIRTPSFSTPSYKSTCFRPHNKRETPHLTICFTHISKWDRILPLSDEFVFYYAFNLDDFQSQPSELQTTIESSPGGDGYNDYGIIILWKCPLGKYLSLFNILYSRNGG